LGLPKCLSGSKHQLLSFIKDRLQSKLIGWYSKCLSQGGKDILLKSIAMALPVYAMSCFKFPKLTIQNLVSVMMEFWWNNSQNQHKIHWISYDKLILPKALGGFGFKDLEVFNQALLATQAWRILHHPESLFSSFFKSRYFASKSFLSASNISLTVAELFNHQTGDWYDPMLRSLFHFLEFNNIKSIRPRIGFPDSYL